MLRIFGGEGMIRQKDGRLQQINATSNNPSSEGVGIKMIAPLPP